MPPWRNGSVLVLHTSGTSSILVGGTKQAAEEKWLTHYPFKVDIAGSIPVGSTIGVEAEWLSD